MVDEALEVSQEGGLPGRTWRARHRRGGRRTRSIRRSSTTTTSSITSSTTSPTSSTSDPVDAGIDPSGGTLTPVAAQSGLKVDEDKLRDDVDKALYDPAERKLKAEVEKVKPEVTTAEVAEKYPTYIVVDRSNFTLTLYENLKQTEEYTVAIGAAGLRHPGRRVRDPEQAGRPGLERARLRLGGQPRRHDRCRRAPTTRSRPAGWASTTAPASTAPTDVGSLGSAASHGCVRMAVADVIDLYDRVDVGTPIYIG